MSKTVNGRSDIEPVSPTIDDSETVTLVLWTRRPVSGPRTEVIDRLSSLKSAGSIDEFEIEIWPERVTLSEHTQHDAVIDRYEEFTCWAEDHDASITPPFERRTKSSLVGRETEVLSVPTMCLAVYEDGLQGVYPCEGEETTWSVTEYLDAVEEEGGRPEMF